MENSGRVRLQTMLASLMVLSFAVSACSSEAGNGGGPAADDPPGQDPAAPARSGPFWAVATSAIGVELGWEPVAGANGYRVESRLAESEWFLLAEVDGSRTTFSDFPAPSGFELEYRLTPLEAGADGDSLSARATTPQVEPNPYTVTVTLEEPDFSSVAASILGYDPSILENLDPTTFDPFDPSTYDPSMLGIPTPEAGEPDLTNIGPEPVSVGKRIGPEGGSVSVTGSNGVVYTLEIPPEALPFTTVFILTPVKEIGGYPFDGGFHAAVNIQPEGVYFDVPARLTFQIPEIEAANTPANSDLVTVGFAFEEGGKEFHLVPIEGDPGLALSPSSGGRLARPAGVPLAASLNGMVLDRTVSAGTGQATRSGVREFGQEHSPSRPSDRAAQEEAARQAEIEEERERMLGRAAELFFLFIRANDIKTFTTLMVEDYRWFVESKNYRLLEDRYKEELWKEAVGKAFELMQPMDCPSEEAVAVQELLRRLLRPRSNFDKEFARWWNLQLGQKGRERLTLLDAVHGCKVKLELTSRARQRNPTCAMNMLVTAKIPLEWRYRDGRQFFHGAGDIVYEGQPEVSGECRTIKLEDLQGTSFVVTELKPIFGVSAEITDWRLAYQVTGRQSASSGTDVRGGSAEGRSTGTSGDLWAGTVASVVGSQWLGQRQWTLGRALAPPLLAEWNEETSASQPGGMVASHKTRLQLMPR